jgi:hypothetical protein
MGRSNLTIEMGEVSCSVGKLRLGIPKLARYAIFLPMPSTSKNYRKEGGCASRNASNSHDLMENATVVPEVGDCLGCFQGFVAFVVSQGFRSPSAHSTPGYHHAPFQAWKGAMVAKGIPPLPL